MWDDLLRFCGEQEIIGAEGGGGETFVVPEVNDRVVGPTEPDGNGLWDSGAANDDFFASDFSLGPMKLLVNPRDGETADLTHSGFET